MSKKPDHRIFYESVERKYPNELTQCKNFVLNHLQGKRNAEYLVSQGVVNEMIAAGIPTVLAVIYGSERFHQILGMIIYDAICIDLRHSDFKGWEYTKTELSERDFLQSVYFKAKIKTQA